MPRRGGTDEVRWFEAEPTYVLHWINAYEDGDEIVLDGFFQDARCRSQRSGADGAWRPLYRSRPVAAEARPHRWRFDLAPARPREEPLCDRIMEFGMINGAVRRPAATATRTR